MGFVSFYWNQEYGVRGKQKNNWVDVSNLESAQIWDCKQQGKNEEEKQKNILGMRQIKVQILISAGRNEYGLGVSEFLSGDEDTEEFLDGNWVVVQDGFVLIYDNRKLRIGLVCPF